MSNAALEFEKIINAGRERKRNEELAARIFSRDNNRRSNTPTRPGAGPSLASRVGVTKKSKQQQQQQQPQRNTRASAGDINGEWTHDLHNLSASRPSLTKSKSTNSLAARIHAPGTAPPTGPAALTKRQSNNARTARLASALARSTTSPAAVSQVNLVSKDAPALGGKGMSIRGLAGPYVVLAQNFAPGTTAADIESAVTPIGGVVTSCRLLKTQPIVIAEIVFESRQGAETVIATFNNQTADGRLLHVYFKPDGPPTGPRAQQRTREARPGNNGVVVDGLMGFDDPMETGGGKDSGLYSDRLVANNRSQEGGGGARGRGRGFHRGRR